MVLLKAGAYAKAEEQYREILKVSPDDVEAQVGLAAALRGEADLGVLYADFLKRPGDAGPLFKRFLSDAPSDHPLRAEAEKYMSASAANAPPPPPPPPPGPQKPAPPPPPKK